MPHALCFGIELHYQMPSRLFAWNPPEVAFPMLQDSRRLRTASPSLEPCESISFQSHLFSGLLNAGTAPIFHLYCLNKKSTRFLPRRPPFSFQPASFTGFRRETVEKVAMTRPIRSRRSEARPADDSVTGHTEVERREESRQNGLIRGRSRKVARESG
jgi:hypothetical protein